MNTRSTPFKAALVAAALTLIAGCATSDISEDTPLRPARDTPDRFLVGSFGGTSLDEPTPGTGCRNPMVDPRNGAELELIRSSEGLGDYQVPQGRYGVGAGQLLRIDCGTGNPLGIVNR